MAKEEAWILSDEDLRTVDEVEHDFVGGAFILRSHGQPILYRQTAIISECAAGCRFAAVLEKLQRLQGKKFRLVQKGTRVHPYLNDRYVREGWRS